jgi:hypothetical protein
MLVSDVSEPDKEGRQSFTAFWLNPSRKGTTEFRSKPSLEVTLCGHRGQCFRAYLDEFLKRERSKGWSVEVLS